MKGGVFVELSHIRDVLLSLTTLITVIGVYTKTFNKFFLDIIKSKYDNVPGQQPLFDTILKSIVYIFCGTEIVTLITSLIFQGKDKIFNEGFNMDWNSIIAIILAILFAVLYFTFINNFFNFRIKFIDKFENGRTINRGEIKKLKNRNKFNLYISIFYFIICIYVIGMYIQLNKTKPLTSKDINAVITIFSVAIISYTLTICCFSFKTVIKFLEDNYVYIIYFEDELIYCSSYLEYTNYYLIIKNGKERYISKSKVKEIQKIKNR
jgi:NADH:ubiquinone oxidoreductase subunit 5 (subunit L)/multisubunit Na+/H+ antiporter MnhA subunit